MPGEYRTRLWVLLPDHQRQLKSPLSRLQVNGMWRSRYVKKWVCIRLQMHTSHDPGSAGVLYPDHSLSTSMYYRFTREEFVAKSILQRAWDVVRLARPFAEGQYLES